MSTNAEKLTEFCLSLLNRDPELYRRIRPLQLKPCGELFSNSKIFSEKDWEKVIAAWRLANEMTGQ